MKRIVCLVLAAICLAALGLCYHQYEKQADQFLFRLYAVPDDALAGTLQHLAEERDMAYCAFTLRSAYVDGEDISHYECLSYHPDALGIVLIQGSPITAQQIAQRSRVAMISESMAVDRSPVLDCIGQEMSINGVVYEIVGIYREASVFKGFTAIDEASVITPAQNSDSERRMYVWFQGSGPDEFAYTELSGKMKILNRSVDTGAFQSVDLDLEYRQGRQNIRLFALILAGILAWRLWKALWQSRCRFYHSARRCFKRHYFFTALMRCVPLGVRGFLPSLLIIGSWCALAVDFLNRLLWDYRIVPARFLDMSAWRDTLSSFVRYANTAEQMPVVGCLTNQILQCMTLFFGIAGILFLLLGLSGQRDE